MNTTTRSRILFILAVAILVIAWWRYRALRYGTGEQAPEFSATLINGESFNTSQFRGNYYLIQFWGSWCGPCRAENPHLVALYKRFHEAGFEILSVGVERNEQAWRRAIVSDGMIWPYHTADMESFDAPLAKKFNVKAIPATFLVNPEGKIVAVNAQPKVIEQILTQNLAKH